MTNQKNDSPLLPDDSQLTAYALGELDGAERTSVELRLQHDAAARATVEAVRALAGELSTALAGEHSNETAKEPAPYARAAIVAGRDRWKLDGGPGLLIRFPQFYYVISGLAAACFVMFVATRSPDAPKPSAKRYTEITLNPAGQPPAIAPVELPAAGVLLADALTAPQIGGTRAPAEEKLSLAPAQAVPLTVAPAEPQSALTAADPAPAPRIEPPGKFAAQPPVSPAPSPSVGSSRLASAGLPPTFAGGGERVVLTPFEVSTNKDVGYAAGNTLSGGRVDTPLAITPGSISVMTKEFTDSFNIGTAEPKTDSYGSRSYTSSRTDLLTRRNVPPAPAESYAFVTDNGFLQAAQNPLSTFSIDVDTASYANVRRFLRSRQRPPMDAVRIEELVNYFPYRSPAPVTVPAGAKEPAPPIAATLEVAAAPWAEGHRLVRILLKARDVTLASRPAANLVFLIDVSGSMNEPKKLPLVKEALRLLVGKLQPADRVAIVTYAGNSGLALPSTPVAEARQITTALDQLVAGGSTNGGMGIHLAYDIAKANFVTGGVNRVILCTDGDFNVGVTSTSELTSLMAEKAKSGVFLTALGFGMGNLKDDTLEKLADNGNGHYGYIDTRREAEKLLVEQVNGTLVTVAKDVKLQVDFNPARVASYRLIGYENRLLKKEDFNDDKVDAGEVGAGHTVTALYEIVPVGAENKSASGTRPVEESKYTAPAASPQTRTAVTSSGELLTVRVRYKEPAGDTSRKLEFPLTDSGTAFADATPDFKFAAAVASFGMILRNSPHKGTATMDNVTTWAAAGVVDDAGGWRSEFIDLTRIAKTL